jgi:hypothetical protein
MIKVVVNKMWERTMKESWIILRYCISIDWTDSKNSNTLSDIKQALTSKSEPAQMVTNTPLQTRK